VVKDIAAGAGLRHAVRQARANTPDTVMSRFGVDQRGRRPSGLVRPVILQ
jgi:hypothetical protein